MIVLNGALVVEVAQIATHEKIWALKVVAKRGYQQLLQSNGKLYLLCGIGRVPDVELNDRRRINWFPI